MSRPNKLIRRVLLLLSLSAVLGACTLNITPPEDAAESLFDGPPTLAFAAPQANTTYLDGVAVNLLLRVTDAGPDITRVEFAVDGAVIATLPDPNPAGDAAFNVAQTWTADAPGTYNLSAAAYRESGVSGTAALSVSVVDALPQQALPTSTPLPPTATHTLAPSATPQADAVTDTPVPAATDALTEPPTTPTEDLPPTPSVPQVTGNGVNIRRGPSTNFEPPIGVLVPGQALDGLALNTAGDWIKVRYAGGEGWLFLSLVSVEGNLAALPREAGPPIPTLAPTLTPLPPTNAPATQAPSGGANLTITGFELVPASPSCGQGAQARVNVANVGTAASGVGTQVAFISVDAVDGTSDFLQVKVDIPSIEPGANFLVVLDYTDNSGGGKVKSAVAVVDPDRLVSEANEDDNTSAPIEYTLGGGC